MNSFEAYNAHLKAGSNYRFAIRFVDIEFILIIYQGQVVRMSLPNFRPLSQKSPLLKNMTQVKSTSQALLYPTIYPGNHWAISEVRVRN